MKRTPSHTARVSCCRSPAPPPSTCSGRLHAALDVPLVLHGSRGVPDRELTAAVAGGIAKVNIGTALNQAMTGAIRAYLGTHSDAVDTRTCLSAGREAMTRTAEPIITVVRLTLA